MKIYDSVDLNIDRSVGSEVFRGNNEKAYRNSGGKLEIVMMKKLN